MTPQVITNVAVEFAGNVGVICTPVLCKAVTVSPAGHILAAVELQVTFVHLRPVATGSTSVVPGAAVGPRFAIVTV